MSHIKVVSVSGGVFRRAGFAFGPSPVVLEVATLREDQLAALHAEPLLSVTEVEEIGQLPGFSRFGQVEGLLKSGRKAKAGAADAS